MKTIKISLILFFLITGFSLNALGHPRGYHNPPPPHCGTVGAPLDGGLLTILGAAGVAYFVARRKKKDSGA